MADTSNVPEPEKTYIKLIRTVEFGLALGCLWAAWTAGGDMFLVVPALIVGMIFAIIGIGTIRASKPYKLTAIGAVTVIYFCIGWFLHWHFQLKLDDSNVPQIVQVAPLNATTLPRETFSTWSQAIYKCKNKGAPDQKTLNKNSGEFKKQITALADTFGYAVQFPKVVGGDKAELTAATPLGLKSMSKIHMTKRIYEIRRIGKDLLGLHTAEFDDTFFGEWISNKHLDLDSLNEIYLRRRIEDLAGVEKGDCELQ
jgi:prepilin signal peptidase PulO-like enzyme (type II secretory pathway)